MLPLDGEHSGLRVLTQLICDLDIVPSLGARSIISPKHSEEGVASLEAQT